MELVLDESFGSGGLPCCHAGSTRLLALLGLMMLSGILDGKGSELVRDSWRGVAHWIVCWVACWCRMKLMWSRSLYLSSRNLNIMLKLCLNVDQSRISNVGDDWCWLVMLVSTSDGWQ